MAEAHRWSPKSYSREYVRYIDYKRNEFERKREKEKGKKEKNRMSKAMERTREKEEERKESNRWVGVQDVREESHE